MLFWRVPFTGNQEWLQMYTVREINHRSDSNQGSDYIVIFLSWISSFQKQHLQILHVQ